MTNAEKRQRVVTDFEQSGLSRREYCSRIHLSVNTLDNWRRKVKMRAAPKFARVEIAALARQSSSSRLTLVLVNGRRIETEAGFDEHEVARLIRAAENSVNQ
jgi:hypothetical protein